MHEILVTGLIVWWIIASVMNAVKAAKRSSTSKAAPPVVRAVPPPRVKKPLAPPSQPVTGYAGRNTQARNPDQTRAIDGASRRLAEGSEYGPIVAEREADRLAEQRFASEVQALIKSEPSNTRASIRAGSPPLTVSNAVDLNADLSNLGQGSKSLINGIILAEVLGEPHCKRNGRRRLR